MTKLEKLDGWWTFSNEHSIRAYYFAPANRVPPPYLKQREVTAILDIASDGTLAGVELVLGDLPPAPKAKAAVCSDSPAALDSLQTKGSTL